MTAAFPRRAQSLLQRATLCYLAVETAWGPHVTPVVFVLDAGRLWVTTARRSVKARAWRQDAAVGGLVVEDDEAVTFRARVRTYDAFDPTSWPHAMLAGPRLLEAAARFTLKNARFFAGYAVDAGKVPLAWTPPGRVFASIAPEAGGIVVGPEVAVRWGSWPGGARSRRSFDPEPAAGRPLDLRVPARVRRALGSVGTGALALQGSAGLSVLPATWRRVSPDGTYEVVLPGEVLGLGGAGPETAAGLAIDVASRWRAAEMTGLLVQGPATIHRPDDTGRGRAALLRRLEGNEAQALVRIRPDRIVWWEGWSSGAVTTSGGRPSGRRRRVGTVVGFDAADDAAAGRT